MDIKRYEHFINGEYVPPVSGEYFCSIDPSTGQTFAEVARGNAEDIDRAVAAAHQALKSWREVEPSERGRILHRVASRILKEADDLARMESIDTGFPLRDCLLVAKDVAARYFEYYSGLADKLGGDDTRARQSSRLHLARAAGRRRSNHPLEQPLV